MLTPLPYTIFNNSNYDDDSEDKSSSHRLSAYYHLLLSARQFSEHLTYVNAGSSGFNLDFPYEIFSSVSLRKLPTFSKQRDNYIGLGRELNMKCEVYSKLLRDGD